MRVAALVERGAHRAARAGAAVPGARASRTSASWPIERKDEFLAMLAHELRNPLAPIRNAVQHPAAASATSETRRRRACEMMERQVDHMVRLVDDLLDVSRITRGKIELRKERRRPRPM